MFLILGEARILGGLGGDRDGLPVLGDPAGDALAELDAERIDDVRVRITRRAQDQLFAFERVNEAGIAGNHGRDELENAVEHGVERVGGGEPAGDFMQEVERAETIAEAGHGGGGGRDATHEPALDWAVCVSGSAPSAA